MDLKEFNLRVKLAKIKKTHIAALKEIILKEKTAYSVAKKTGITQAQLSRSKKRLLSPICECCGQLVLNQEKEKTKK